MNNEAMRTVPSVERVIAALRERATTAEAVMAEAARAAVANARERALAGIAAEFAAVVEEADERARVLARPSLRRVINASGVLLQTNLGRAPLSERAIAAMADVARGYSNLEFDLDSGARGSRHEHVRRLIRLATGAEDGIVVNNNAAALFFVLQAFASGREVIVSRGQAVEIGGGFRIPDVLRQSGARLVEVGTTNRTYGRDYSAALTAETAAILRVHTSNFRVVGFVAEAGPRELAEVAHGHGALLIDDLGSGCLVDTRAYGMAAEPTIQASLNAGTDLALFSGDKLLGGPQCGIIAGRGELVERLRRHPLARALRVDKLTIAALNATLQAYVECREREEIPLWRMAGAPLDEVRRRAALYADAGGGSLLEARTMVGGGSLPGEGVATWCAAFEAESADGLAAALRGGEPAVVGRIEDGRVLLDPRSIDPDDDAAVVAAVALATGTPR